MTPQTTIQGLTFFPVPDFDGPTSAFGAPASAFFDRRNLPDVPRKFEDMAQGLLDSNSTAQSATRWTRLADALKANMPCCWAC